MGALGMAGGGGIAGGVVAVEVCAPLLLLCWLCCWPDDASSDTSSTGKHPRKPVVRHESGCGSHSRLHELVGRRAPRVASSAVSLHLPGTSGDTKLPLSAHRSHEEIPSRHRSNHEASSSEQENTRYHSAPSVIDEVLHRRDWDRSTRELYIPLRPEAEIGQLSETPSPEPRCPSRHNEPESSSVEWKSRHNEPESSSVEWKSNEKISCKKHYTNIKSSKNKLNKESNTDDVKDTDATENVSNFYIGETWDEASVLRESREEIPGLVVTSDDKIKSVYKAKDVKQSINESIKIKEQPIGSVDEDFEEMCRGEARVFDVELCVDELDRSGAWHHHHPPDSPSCASVSRSAPYPPPSVALVGYEGAACYLTEDPGQQRPRTRRVDAPGAAWGRGAGPRARHASDGDILAPTHRPESGAFSESDLDLEPESEELPPPYHELELQPCAPSAAAPTSATRSHTETAI